MDKCREQFEVFCKKHNYRTDKSKLGGYVYHVTSSCWDAWQASRQALVVELPYQYEPEIGKDHIMDSEEVKGSLDKAGIKWTE